MTITKAYPENLTDDKRLVYALTRSKTGLSIQQLPEGEIVTPDAWLLYDETDADGNTQTVLSILDNNKGVCGGVSAVFREEFLYISELMGSDPYSIKIVHRKSKAGRTYTTCELA